MQLICNKVIGPPSWNAAGVLKPKTPGLTIGEYSPAFAKRNDVPQAPLRLRPASSESIQVAPSFGLLVPPGKRAVILVMAPRGFEFQPSEERYGIAIAEDGDVQLSERGPNIIGLGIDEGCHGQIG